MFFVDLEKSTWDVKILSEHFFPIFSSRAYVKLECEGCGSCKIKRRRKKSISRLLSSVFTYIFKSVLNLIALILNHLRFQAYDQIELTAETLKITVLCVAICVSSGVNSDKHSPCFWLIRVIFPDQLVQLIDWSTRETVDFWRCWGQTFNCRPEPKVANAKMCRINHISPCISFEMLCHHPHNSCWR